MARRSVNAIIHPDCSAVMENTYTKRIEGSVAMQQNSITPNVSETAALLDIAPRVNPEPSGRSPSVSSLFPLIKTLTRGGTHLEV